MPARKVALVLDDRQTHLDEVRQVLEVQGYQVNTVKSLREAKKAVLDSGGHGISYDLIVSDFDLGGKLYQKHRWFDGYRFVKWCKEQKLKSQIIFHSTAFEPNKKIIYFLHQPVIRGARKRGITVQGKSVLMPSFRDGGKGPLRRKGKHP